MYSLLDSLLSGYINFSFFISHSRDQKCPYCRQTIERAFQLYINFEPQVHGDRAGLGAESQDQNATLNALQAMRNDIQAVLRTVSLVNRGPQMDESRSQLEPRRSARLQRLVQTQPAGTEQIGVLRRQNETECFLQVPLPFMFIPGQTQLRVAVRGNDLTIHFTRRS